VSDDQDSGCVEGLLEVLRQRVQVIVSLVETLVAAEQMLLALIVDAVPVMDLRVLGLLGLGQSDELLILLGGSTRCRVSVVAVGGLLSQPAVRHDCAGLTCVRCALACVQD
jgi:hypothetical protein